MSDSEDSRILEPAGGTLMMTWSLMLAMMVMISSWMMWTWVLLVGMLLTASLVRPRVSNQWGLPSLLSWHP